MSELVTVDADPTAFRFDPARTALVLIDMQRDFVEPGGFGETLGNDVSTLQAVIPPLRTVLDDARARGLMVIHTREGHLPDLSDCPPAKLSRGAPSLRIGDPGPRGRILVRGEVGHDIIDDLAPVPGELVVDKPGKGSFYSTGLHEYLKQHGINVVDRHRRHHRGVRAHHRSRGQRPGLRVPRSVRLRRLVLPGVPTRRAGDDQRPGRDLRLGRAVRCLPGRIRRGHRRCGRRRTCPHPSMAVSEP